MRKHYIYYIIIAMFTIIPMNLNAQKEHIKFMGIPLDGNINNFQTKLAYKGFFSDHKFDNDPKFEGTRIYKGNFLGRDCDLYVNFTQDSTVFHTRLCFVDSTENALDNFMQSINDMLSAKYSEDHLRIDTDEQGFHTYTYYVVDSEEENCIGEIILKMTFFRFTVGDYMFTFYLDYLDTLNYRKYKQDQL